MVNSIIKRAKNHLEPINVELDLILFRCRTPCCFEGHPVEDTVRCSRVIVVNHSDDYEEWLKLEGEWLTTILDLSFHQARTVLTAWFRTGGRRVFFIAANW